MSKQKRGAIGACSFCGKEHDQERRLIAGPGVAICNECVGLCSEILQRERVDDGSSEPGRTAHELQSLPSQVLLEGLRSRSVGIHQAQQQLQEVVTILRQRGTTWARIGEALGVSRQSAWERYSGEE